MKQPHICVIGAGIAGVCSAYWLSQSGFKVTLMESERYPAQRTSRANGSQLSACNAHVWSTWPQIRKAMGWMWDKEAPFRIDPSWEWRKIKWLMQFVQSAARNDHITRTQLTVQHALHSAQALQHIVNSEQIEFDHVQRGILHVYSDLNMWHQAQALEQVFEEASCAWRPFSSDSCVTLEPSLHNYKDLVGGIYTDHDATGDMHKFCTRLTARMENMGDVKCMWNTKVSHVHPSSTGVIVSLSDDTHMNFDGILIANGVWAPDLLKQVSDPVNIYPVKGYSVTIKLDDASQQAAPWVSMLDEQTKIVCSRLGSDRLRVAGTAELCGYNWDITRDRVMPLLNWVHKNFPQVNTTEYTPWAGLRPMTPDQMPVVRQSVSSDRVWLAVGLGHLGWTLSPGMTRELVDNMAETYGLK